MMAGSTDVDEIWMDEMVIDLYFLAQDWDKEGRRKQKEWVIYCCRLLDLDNLQLR